jgi:hypothetical protein
MERADEIRHGVLALHRAIVAFEKAGHERRHGRMTAAAFLAVLVEAEEFAWLRPLTTLIVQLDEVLDEPEPSDADSLDAWRSQLRALLTPSAAGSAFQQRYAQLLQSSPDVALVHATVMRLLRG